MSLRELDLDRALTDLAASLEFPPTPDLAAAVSARLDEAPATRPRPRRWSWPAGWRRLAVAGLAAVLLAAAVLVASPGTREAVARRAGAARRRVRQRGRSGRRPGRPGLGGPARPARLGLHRRRAADHPVQ